MACMSSAPSNKGHAVLVMTKTTKRRTYFLLICFLHEVMHEKAPLSALPSSILLYLQSLPLAKELCISAVLSFAWRPTRHQKTFALMMINGIKDSGSKFLIYLAIKLHSAFLPRSLLA
ncbi:hypothetical protein CDAR_584571 [Caerostris darwini]|uniref:Uncharacterized protein n=1 Tax=Caerostris darwini TaxID=1538125 RepID=A0AAV4WHB8_9ARAC|nr:hypothetical protein CDAR_584571 [Caerostris darwini]